MTKNISIQELYKTVPIADIYAEAENQWFSNRTKKLTVMERSRAKAIANAMGYDESKYKTVERALGDQL